LASLMEDLITVLNNECDQYEKLLEVSGRKTPIIVSGDLEQLAIVTEEEQNIVGHLANLETQRNSAMNDIANVLNKDVRNLKLTDLIKMLDKRPTEQKQLSNCTDRLREVADKVKLVNGQNRQLIESSLEMVNFELNILQSDRVAPQTANYSKAAGTTGQAIGLNLGRFDAKQ